MYKIASELIKIAHEIISGGIAVKRNTVFFNSLIRVGKRSGRMTYKDEEGYYYQWDSLHGEWQIFGKKGKHFGTLDENGNFKKMAVPGRKINLK